MTPQAPRRSEARRRTPAVGDEARVPADVRNEFGRYGQAPGSEAARQPIDGIVIAIREVSSGRPVKVAAGDPRRYVFDLLHDQTFDPRVSSKTNSQGAMAGRLRDSPAFQRVQQALRQLAHHAAVTRGMEALAAPPLRDLLDGWRLIRVCAAQVDVTEPTGPA